ncbi:hypothetical protein AXE80_11990 [Wenyingzhuangia fucanilytica]|uniref:Secretion system C-terminal sorting domain-containing protein n=1 Tax=Wenyingzhuangia fucanilytica TaxID=1790137 RepID=A0A1B1Y845_9FLAO|nr:T9SS type A sorting domain-containing protein [Wenyingzhuangia fucanilytica]ANW96953.1 hypothetical protein AXE80_11990 [Wenyingzhuangia fucanilytica]
MKSLFILVLSIVLSVAVKAQDKGPGGIGTTDGSDIYLWVKTDGLSAGALANWTDNSGNSNSLSQAAGTDQPTIVTNTWNGFPVAQFDGANDHIFVSIAGLTSTANYSVIAAWEQTDATPGNYGALFSSETASPSTSGSFQIAFNNDGDTSGLPDSFQVGGVGTFDIDTEGNSYATIMQKHMLYFGRSGDGASGGVAEFIESYINEANYVSKFTGNTNATYFDEFKIGANRGNGSKIQMNLSEFVIYKNALTDVERIILANYLATKYDFSLSANTVYEGGASGYDFDVAGVGQDDNGDQHLSAQGTGIVAVTLAGGGSLNNDEYLMWGHNGVDVTTASTVSYSPASGSTTTIDNQLDRIWYMSENDASGVSVDLGTGSVLLDMATLSHDISNDSRIRLLVDDDGVFGTGTTGYTGTITSGIATFTGVDFNDGYVFTFGSTNSGQPIGVIAGNGIGGYSGPGGIGNNNGSDMYLWLRADLETSISTETGVSQWNDQSGNNNNVVQATSADQPSYQTSVINGLPVVRFDGESASHELTADIADITDESYTIIYIWDFTKSTTAIAQESIFSSSNSSSTTDSFQHGFAGTSPTNLRWQTTSHQMVQEADFSSGTIGIDTPNVIIYTREANETSTSYSNNTQTLSKTLTGSENSVFTHFKLGENRGGGKNIDADLAEMIILNNSINDVERTIISNYLSAKYNTSLTANDIYDGDDDGYDYDVAGIGNDGTYTHLDSQGTGIVRINNASGLGNDEYLFWGANVNNTSLHTFSRVETGDTDFSRLDTHWKVSESDASGGSVNVGQFDISFDLSKIDFGELDVDNCLDLKLVVDQDDADAIFNTVSRTIDLTIDNGFAFASLSSGSDITDNDIFTLQYQDAIVRESDTWNNTIGGDVAPDNSDACYKLVIKENQEVTLTSDINVLKIEVESGAVLTVNSGLEINIEGGVVLNGTGQLKLLGTSQLIQHHTGETLNTGTNFYNTITPPTKNQFVFSYFGSPVDEGSGEYTVGGVLKDGRINALSATTTGDDITFISNDSDGYQSGSETAISENWIYSYEDGETGADFVLKQSTGSFDVGLGFSMKYPGTSSQPLIYNGRPNSGSYTIPIERDVYTMISNPYPSAIDADVFISDNDSAITGTLYFLEQQATISSHYQSDYELGYSTWSTGIGTAASVAVSGTAGLGVGTYTAPDQYIAVGQGFLVAGDHNGGNIVFDNNQRVFKELGEDGSGVDGSVFFKQSKAKTITPKIPTVHIGFEFQLSDDVMFHRNLGVSFKKGNNLTNNDQGYDSYIYDQKPSDAYFGVQTVNNYEDESVEYKDEKFVTVGVEEFNENIEIPIFIGLDQDRTVYFRVDEYNGIDNTIYLTDVEAGTQEVLTGGVVSKQLSLGEYSNRFYVTFKEDQSLKNDHIISEDFSITKTEGNLVVLSSVYKINKLSLFSITGSLVQEVNQSTINISRFSNGLYILKIDTNDGVSTIKVVL